MEIDWKVIAGAFTAVISVLVLIWKKFWGRPGELSQSQLDDTDEDISAAKEAMSEAQYVIDKEESGPSDASIEEAAQEVKAAEEALKAADKVEPMTQDELDQSVKDSGFDLEDF